METSEAVNPCQPSAEIVTRKIKAVLIFQNLELSVWDALEFLSHFSIVFMTKHHLLRSSRFFIIDYDV
jgi:hypothetical protein